MALDRQAVSLAKSSLQPGDTLIEHALKYLGHHYAHVGSYQTAIPILQEFMQLQVERLGPDHLDIATVCHAIGNLYWWSGNLSDGEDYHRRAMSIREKALGPENWMVAANIHNLGNIALDRGDFAEAERLELKALSIRKKSLEPGNREFAKSYQVLGDLAIIRGDYSEAEDWFYRAREILEAKLGMANQPYVLCLRRIGIAHRQSHEFDTADVIFRKAIHSSKLIFGGPHHWTADIVQELAVLSHQRGMIDSSIQQFAQSIEIRDSASASDRPQQAFCYEQLCRLYLDQGHKVWAMEAASNAVDIRQRNFILNGDILPERQALLYSGYLRNSVDNYIRTLWETNPNSAENQSRLADMILATKGLVSDVMTERRLALKSETDEDITKLIATVDDWRRRASRMFVQGPGKNPAEYSRAMDSLLTLSHEAESELFRKSRHYKKRTRHLNISSQSIRDVLPLETAIVEYYQVVGDGGINSADSSQYFAVILGHNIEARVVNLGTTTIIDSLMNCYRDHMEMLSMSGSSVGADDMAAFKSLSAALYSTIWAPVERYCGKSSNVIISPDGRLNLLSFAGLTLPDGSYLIESSSIRYVSAARDLLKNHDDQPATSGLLVMGDPDFNAAPLPLFAELSTAEKDNARVFRGFGSSCLNLTDIIVSPLPSTNSEVRAVAGAWNRTTDEPTAQFLGIEANESNFKMKAPGSRVIYLATHGYYLIDSCSSLTTNSDYQFSSAGSNLNPLLLSGLFLAGANLQDSEIHGSRTEDGVLTAYEVAGLDFEGTELVVLSACQTGLGQVNNGEGVYGLCRAFQMAGANAVISSLWAIPDQSTADMMSEIFEHGDKSLADRLNVIQTDRLHYLRDNGKFDHPIDWAAFVAIGSWR